MSNIYIHMYNREYFPNSFPMISAGKLNCKIRLKKEQMKADGTFTIYIQISLNRTVKKISLGFSVLEKDFDLKNQRVKSSNQYH